MRTKTATGRRTNEAPTAEEEQKLLEGTDFYQGRHRKSTPAVPIPRAPIDKRKLEREKLKLTRQVQVADGRAAEANANAKKLEALINSLRANRQVFTRRVAKSEQRESAMGADMKFFAQAAHASLDAKATACYYVKLPARRGFPRYPGVDHEDGLSSGIVVLFVTELLLMLIDAFTMYRYVYIPITNRHASLKYVPICRSFCCDTR